MSFKLAQTFYVDAAAVQNVLEIGITGVNLYFKSIPNPINNKSNIQYPGVEIFLVRTKNSIPKLSGMLSSATPKARVAYTDIRSSKTANIPTRFRFDTPIIVKTNKEYAFVVKYDGNEDFELWTSKQGDLIVGTTTVSPGPSGKYVGNYYNFTNVPTSGATANSADPWDALVSPDEQSDTDLLNRWKPVNDTDLKFKVFCARYYKGGVAVDDPLTTEVLGGNSTGSGAARFLINRSSYEYALYDQKNSADTDFKGGDNVFQVGPFYPGGYSNSSGNQFITISVTANSDLITANTKLPNGSNFVWDSIFAFTGDEYIIINSNNHPAIVNQWIVRKVSDLVSNSVLRVTEKLNISNSVARFFKSPVAELEYVGTSKIFGEITDMAVLNNSNANSTIRFVNNSILSITVNSGGSGYSNTDYLTVNGYENITSVVTGGYPARANLVTNSSGGITAVYISNVGCGFVDPDWLEGSNVVISNNTGGSTAGSSANLTFDIGATLQTEHGGNGGYFKNVTIANFEVGQFSGYIDVDAPSGTSYKMYHQFPYYTVPYANTVTGKAYYVTEDDNENRVEIRNRVVNRLAFDDIPVIPSRSNQFVITNGTSVLTPPKPSTNTTVDATSNNDFTCITVPRETKFAYGKFVINDDYTGENTDQGNAYAKHITSKINLANNTFAEDLVVYLTAYRPANTDIKVFARIHNSNDTEAFEDKDWTLLEMKEGRNLYSNPQNKNDLKEYTYGFSLSPNTVVRLAGSANITDSNAVILTGSDTKWAANSQVVLQPFDLIRISPPLFPNNYVIRVVDSVVSNTEITINKPTSNDDVVGEGLIVDFIGRIGNNSTANVGYPLQAFNNKTNDNVARYYTSSMVEVDTYNTFQLKIVLLADPVGPNAVQVYPMVDNMRTVGVTA